MNRFTHTLTNVGAIAALVVSSYALTSAALAETPATSSTSTAAELQAKADHHAMMAADYRARMRVDDKHAITWFTMANHCDQKAQAYHLAALQAAGTEPVYRR
jgi:hypothetical protein